MIFGLCELLAEWLRAEGCEFGSHVRDLERALSREHALVVLDLMLPGLNGLDVLRRLRTQSQIPVSVLTARGEDVGKILGA
jgi:two-component system response regulator CpxR